MESNESTTKTAPVTTVSPTAPAAVTLSKAEIWAKEGRCSICGKPVWKADGDTGAGSTCKSHIGKLRSQADSASEPPAGWIRMSEVCRKAVDAGLTIGSVVKAAGGDAATEPVLDPLFRVVYVGRAKYMDPRVLTVGFDMIRKSAAQPKEPKVAPVSKAPLKAAPAPAQVAAPAPTKGTASALKKAVVKK